MKKSVVLIVAIAVSFSIIPAFSQWTQCNGPFGGSVRALLAHNNTFFAGTYSGNIFRSNDLGKSWQETTSTIKLPGIYSLCAADTSILAATDEGMYKSDDGGYTWKNYMPGTRVNALVAYKKCLFAGTDKGVLKSTDNGITWENILSDKKVSVISNSTNSEYERTVVAATRDSCYISYDLGDTWKSVFLTKRQVTAAFTQSIGITISTAGDGLFISKFKGDTFKQSLQPSMSVQSLWAMLGNNIYAGTQDGAYCYEGDKWRKVLSSSLVLSEAHTNGRICIGTLGTGIYSNDYATSETDWQHHGLQNQYIGVSNIVANDSVIYTATENAIYKSGNNGNTWEQTGIQNDFFIKSLAITGDTLITVTDKGVNFSTDAGKKWRDTQLFAPVISLCANKDSVYTWTENEIYAAKTKNLNNWTLFTNKFGSIDKLLLDHEGGLYALADGGVHKLNRDSGKWNKIFTSGKVNSIETLKGAIIIGTEKGLYYSTDDGLHWDLSMNNLTVNTLLYIDSTRAFVGTNKGIYIVKDKGTIWGYSGLENKSISSLWQKGEYVYAGTNNAGVWKFDLSTIASADDNTPLEYESAIQCYPNPAQETVCVDISQEMDLVNTPIASGAIIALNGTVVQPFDLHGSETCISIKNLSSGQYILQIHATHKTKRLLFNVIH